MIIHKKLLIFTFLLLGMGSIPLKGTTTPGQTKAYTYQERFLMGLTRIKFYLKSYIYHADEFIWDGTIGANRVKVQISRSESYFKRYDIDRPQALQIWAQDRHLFEKLLPLLKKYDAVYVVMGYSDAACTLHDTDFNHAVIFIGKMWPTFTTAEKEFVIAHELSHLMLEHMPLKSEKDFKSAAVYYGYRKECEKEADLHAAQLIGTAQGGISLLNKLDTCTRQACAKWFYTEEVDQLMSTIVRSKAKDRAQHIAVLRAFYDDRVKKHNWSLIKRMYESYKMFRICGHLIKTTHPQDIERVRYLQDWEKGSRKI